MCLGKRENRGRANTPRIVRLAYNNELPHQRARMHHVTDHITVEGLVSYVFRFN